MGLGEFRAKVHEAKIMGDKTIEAEDFVFQHFNQGQDVNLFIYEGIKVFRSGKTEETEREMDTPLEQKIFNSKQVEVK